MKFSKSILKISLLTLLLGTTLNNSYAASDDECAIWLCAPVGFPPGCGAARSAMHSRVRHHKSPIPSWSSCSQNNNEGMNEKYGYAAYIPERTVQDKCIRESSMYTYGKRACLEYSYKTVPATYVKGASCVRNCGSTGCSTIPNGCTATYYYVDIYQNGQQIGETYYFTY